jgi:hypothetical protein
MRDNATTVTFTLNGVEGDKAVEVMARNGRSLPRTVRSAIASALGTCIFTACRRSRNDERSKPQGKSFLRREQLSVLDFFRVRHLPLARTKLETVNRKS